MEYAVKTAIYVASAILAGVAAALADSALA